MIEMILTSSFLILAILLLRKVTQGRISMRFRYALWLLAVLRLILPVSLGNSAWSVMNLWPQDFRETVSEQDIAGGFYLPGIREENNHAMTGAREPEESRQPETVTGQIAEVEKQLPEQNGGQEAVTVIQGNPEHTNQVKTEEIAGNSGENRQGAGSLKSYADSVRIRRGLLLLWLVGALAVGGYMISSQIRFVRILYRYRDRFDQTKLPRRFAEEFQKRRIKVYQVKGLASPCLVGRNIYIDTELTEENQRLVHILAHEYCHALHHDTLWAFLRCVLAALYWFHPLVWAAAFAARQDSELACDEAVLRLLGEEERFAYGRTLLYLLACGREQIDCAGTALTMEGRKRGVKERVIMISKRSGQKRWMAAVVIAVMLAVCGCAFTGRNQEAEVLRTEEAQQSHGDEREGTDSPQVLEESDNESERILEDYQAYEQILDGQAQALGEAEQETAFFQALNYQGVMAGKDDSELSLNREIDYQAYYEYLYRDQNDSQEEKPGNPLENGWYLVCRNEEAQISLYGLYTEEFGCRGVKMLIGEDVNTYDIPWCPGIMNGSEENIRVLEKAQDGLPRRFVWKLLSENTSGKEIWNLYSGYRYDTGTVEVEELTAQMYRDWVEKNLSFTVSESQEEVLITYDGDMVLAPLDISAYQDQKVEKVLLSPDVAGFELDDRLYDGGVYEGYEGVVIYLAVGLKLEGRQGIWFDGLHPLMIQVVCHPQEDPAFVLQSPRIEEQLQLHSPLKEQKLNEIRSGEISSAPSSEGEGRLSKPLVNDEAGGHHDLEICFVNPCPDYDRISDGYGERIHPVTGEIRKHNGVDMAAAGGAPVAAAADGSVYETGFDAEYGNYVVLWHGQSGQMTYYSHCGEVLVSEGQQVKAGDVIATVGNTGRSTGYHLHFAVSYEGEWEEPLWKKE